MPLLWHRLHRQLLDTTRRKSFIVAFAALRRTDDNLSGISDLSQMIALHHGKDCPRERKLGVLRALVAGAQSADTAMADAALTSLLLILWPGLTSAHARLRRHFPHDADDLPGEILVRASAAIRTMDLSRVREVAAAIVLGCRRDVMRDRLAQSRCLDLPPAETPLDADERLLAREVVDLLGSDATLVLAVAVDGQSQIAAGAEFGLGPELAWKRYRRAVRRIQRCT